jgi:hypothetical protein
MHSLIIQYKYRVFKFPYIINNWLLRHKNIIYVPPVVIPHSFSASACFSCSVKSPGKIQFASSFKNNGLNPRHSGEQAWKAIRDRLRRPYYLSRVDHVRKIRDRKQRTDIRKYSYVNETIKNWNKLPSEALGTFLVNQSF